jgi:plasmid stabilization system protein ParE
MKQYKLNVIPAAFKDLSEARGWYWKINPELSKRFHQQVKVTMEQISSLPASHAIRYNNVRIANIAVFPYAVHFIIINSNTVVVLAIHHTAINPDKWLDRI